MQSFLGSLVERSLAREKIAEYVDDKGSHSIDAVGIHLDFMKVAQRMGVTVQIEEEKTADIEGCLELAEAFYKIADALEDSRATLDEDLRNLFLGEESDEEVASSHSIIHEFKQQTGMPIS
jgi:hypothetical protein